MERLDERAVRALDGRLNRSGAIFLSGEYSAQAITGILRRLSMLVTSRYHAAVLSMETGCPIVAVSMDGIMRELSLDGKYLFHSEKWIRNFNTVYYVLKLMLLGKMRVFPMKPETALNLLPGDYVADCVSKSAFREKRREKPYTPSHDLEHGRVYICNMAISDGDIFLQ